MFGYLFTILVAYHVHTGAVNIEKPVKNVNVAVIGAGVSGLAGAKHLLAQGYSVTVYEQSEQIGGIWKYTDQTGKDQYGINVHTAMYQGLRYSSHFITKFLFICDELCDINDYVQIERICRIR